MFEYLRLQIADFFSNTTTPHPQEVNNMSQRPPDDYSTPTANPIPHIHLLCMQSSAAKAFTAAIQEHNLYGSFTYTIHESSLSQLDPHIRFNAVVSPANSYGLLDGGFDDAISRAWSPKDDYYALTRALQADLYKHYRGFQSPGTCHLFLMPAAFRGKLRYNDGNGWGCEYIAHCPTMRVPSDCVWNREVVYECIWNMLCAIDKHNTSLLELNRQFGSGALPGSEDGVIKSILMTPLGTGVGGVSNERWAGQVALAIKHYIDAVNNSDKWSRLDWRGASYLADEVEQYHEQ